ncbi:hypothetical protein [Deinococcus apachensis]|uniref:hypothetical protein n=1 Tax=Deinococcus apachensis TaxID=309886 RepID=UPI0003603B7A|nr:hypothetical protein [Deinococcus apachensis]
MQQLTARVCLGVLQAGLLLVTGTALADGSSYTGAAHDAVQAEVTFQCQGGVRVHVTRRTKTVRVDFAGQSQTLNRNPSGTSARNTQFTWVTQSQGSYMKDNRTGQLELSGCRPVG